MRWQGHLRYLAKSEDVHVRCEKGWQYLYKDFAATTLEFLRPDIAEPQMWRPVQPEDGILLPSKATCEARDLKQEFIKYGKVWPNKHYDVLIHARHKAPYSRNWPDLSWDILADHLDGLKVAYIGSRDGARLRKHGEDLRGLPIEKLANVMASSKVCVGESSFPLHFASMCGLPHVVMTCKRKWNLGCKKSTNWVRYKRAWNPLGTRCTVLDENDWDPPWERVLKVVEGYL